MLQAQPADLEGTGKRSSRAVLGLLALCARALAVYLVMAGIAGAWWFNRNFGRVDADQILYHLQQSPAALTQASRGLVRSGIEQVLLVSLAGTVLVLLAISLAGRRWHGRPRAARALRLASGAPGLVLACAATGAWASQMVLAPPAPDTGVEGDWMQARYVVPRPLEAPARKRNLLLVYAESLEASFSQGAFSGHALLAPLDEDKLPGLSFPLFLQAPGTGWTIAGMVASQCGVPLKPLGVFGENLLGEMASGFLPRARCLGDVLKDSGYRNVFLGGASAAFAGKARFLRTHGYDEVRGREDWAAAHPALAMNDWGADDDFLFDQALQRLRELKATGQPFNLTLLTLGLHPPAGYLSPRCERPHGDMRDAVLCTAALIRRFLDAAHEQHLLDDTVVLVVGDHLSARSELSPGLQTVDDRTIYNRLSTPEPVVANRAKIDHFDLYPTLLAALGFQLGDGGLALGCSAIGTVGCRSLVDDPTAVAGLRRRSATYESLWSGAAAEDDADD